MGERIHNIKINVLEGGHWGTGDTFDLAGVEIWLMYFTIEKVRNEIKDLLEGKYLGRIDSYYYPIGRCAMLKNIRSLYDPHYIFQSIQEQLTPYPIELMKASIQYHSRALEDTEDFERAVIRKDVLFYHFALDLALHHFLQLLFAVNQVYFPSRKRSLQYIEGFDIKPHDCAGRLLKIIESGGISETLKQSYEMWLSLVNDLKRLLLDLSKR